VNFSALINTRTTQAEQRQLIECLAAAQSWVIGPWLTCDPTELGSLEWVSGDTVVMADAGHCLAGQTASGCMKIIETWLGQGITLVFANTRGQLSPSMLDQPSTVLRVVADSLQIPDQTCRRRKKARAAAIKRRKAGLHNGRKPGAVVRCKLDAQQKMIEQVLGQGGSKTALAKQLKVSRSTLYVWLKRQKQ
jgi:hypothetical protein